MTDIIKKTQKYKSKGSALAATHEKQDSQPNAALIENGKNMEQIKLQLCVNNSNLYQNISERLCLQFSPVCVKDFNYCQKNHLNAPLPPKIEITQRQSLNIAIDSRHDFYIKTLTNIAHRRHFPGHTELVKVLELILSVNTAITNCERNYGLQNEKFVELFDLLISAFPPCWRSLRSSYLELFKSSLDSSKIWKNNNVQSKSNSLLDNLLDLLDNSLDLKDDAAVVQATPEVFLDFVHFEVNQRQQQTFEAQPRAARLERIFAVLILLVKILEQDFATWLLQHCNDKFKSNAFWQDNNPLLVSVFGLKQLERVSVLGMRIFDTFARLVNLRLEVDYVQVMERYVNLILLGSNQADMRISDHGIAYPSLSDSTKNVIAFFFQRFKAGNSKSLQAFVHAAHILRLPFLRCEFIYKYLQLFSPTKASNFFSLEKLCLYEMQKKRWLKFKEQAADDFSREQYLQLLLLAVQAHWQWHGYRDMTQFIYKDVAVPPLKGRIGTPHRQLITSGELSTERLEKQVKELEKATRMSAFVCQLAAPLPKLTMNCDIQLQNKFISDLRYWKQLREIVVSQSEDHVEMDWNKWLEFIQLQR